MTGKAIANAVLESVSILVFSKPNMDVVVVTAVDVTYAHAQVIRNQSNMPVQYPCSMRLNKSQNAYAHQLANLVAGRHLALFVGVGVSIGSGLPSWFGLLNLTQG